MKILYANNPPLDEEALKKLEQRISHDLPADYKSFLKEYNGGRPENNTFQIPDCSEEALIDFFLGIDRNREDINHWIDELTDLEGQFIPIAFDPGANAIIMDYTDCKVYYWDSARHFKTSSDDENTYWIADSFSDFLDKLKP